MELIRCRLARTPDVTASVDPCSSPPERSGPPKTHRSLGGGRVKPLPAARLPLLSLEGFVRIIGVSTPVTEGLDTAYDSEASGGCRAARASGFRDLPSAPLPSGAGLLARSHGR